MKIVVSRNELQAAMLFASTDESRYVLNSVCIDARPKKQPIMVATDGRRLCVIETVADQVEEIEASMQLLLRADFLRVVCALSKAIGGKLRAWLQFETVPGSQRLSVALVGADCVLHLERDALIEGAFPKWEKVIPPKSKHTRQPISDMGINAAIVGDFAKAGKFLGNESAVVQMNLVGKESAVEVKLIGLSNFYGLVMQCKCDESVEYQPEFLGIVKDLPKTEVTVVLVEEV